MHISESILLIATQLSFFLVLLFSVTHLEKDYSEQRKLFVIVYFYANLFYFIFLISKIFSLDSRFILTYKIAPIIILSGFFLILLLFMIQIQYLALVYFFFSAILFVVNYFHSLYLHFLFKPLFIFFSVLTFSAYSFLYIKTKNNKVLLLLFALLFYASAGFCKIFSFKAILYIAANFSVYCAIAPRPERKK